MFSVATWVRGILCSSVYRFWPASASHLGHESRIGADWNGMQGKVPPRFWLIPTRVVSACALHLRITITSTGLSICICELQIHNYAHAAQFRVRPPWAWALIIRPVLRHLTIVMQRSWSQDGHPLRSCEWKWKVVSPLYPPRWAIIFGYNLPTA